MKALFSLIDALVEALGLLVTCALIVVAFIQVFWRYVLNNALPWPEEISLMLFLWMSYLGVVMAMKREAHLRVDAFVMALPERGQRFMRLVCLGASVLLCAAVTYMSFHTAMRIMSRGQTAISVPLPVWYVWMGIPFCFALAALQAARRFLIVLKGEEE